MLTHAEAESAATDAVDNYCVNPPDSIRTAAIGRLTNWIERSPSAGESSINHSDQSVSWQKSDMASGIMLSGSAALLAPWRRPRARLVEAAP